MTIYEPVTDIGKAIAKALTRDDGIRLDVHDILERWEPEYVADMEKAELLPIYEKQYGNMVEHALELEDKLEAIKTRITRYEKLVTMPDPADLDLIEDIKKILEAEGCGV